MQTSDCRGVKKRIIVSIKIPPRYGERCSFIFIYEDIVAMIQTTINAQIVQW